MKMTVAKLVPAAVVAAGLALAACGQSPIGAAQATESAAEAPLTQQEVAAAQKAWGDALVKIATTYDTAGEAAARQAAAEVIDSAYGYATTPVLFKPTLTVAPQTFRTTREGALAYFVGGDANFPKDTGFALKGWRDYKIENAAVFIDGDVALTMGNVRLTDRNGNVTVVDKTWGFQRGDDGKLRIVLHHSSLPYQP